MIKRLWNSPRFWRNWIVFVWANMFAWSAVYCLMGRAHWWQLIAPAAGAVIFARFPVGSYDVGDRIAWLIVGPALIWAFARNDWWSLVGSAIAGLGILGWCVWTVIQLRRLRREIEASERQMWELTGAFRMAESLRSFGVSAQQVSEAFAKAFAPPKDADE